MVGLGLSALTPLGPHQGAYNGNTSAWPLYPWDRIQTLAVYGDDISPALLEQAKATSTRVALTMGGPDDSGAPNETVRAAWVASTIAGVRKAGASAVNMDVEATMKSGSAQSAAMSALLSELGSRLRAEVPGAELSFDAAARPCYEHRCYNYTAIADAVDRIFVMDYESEPPSALEPLCSARQPSS